MTRLEAFKYQSRVVAFIDVLGFKQLVNESDKSPLKRDKVAKLVETNRVLEQYAEKLLTSELAAATFFSDSFVISAKCDNAIFLIREVVYLCRRLLVLGLPPCRGAITVGSLYHRERIAVGPALVAAYEMETSTAVYPRVILDKCVVELWEAECAPGSESSSFRALVKQDHDGQHFLDIFYPLWFDSASQSDFISTADAMPTDQAEFLKVASGQIKKGLAMPGQSEKTYVKYLWLDSQCNSWLTAAG